MTGIENISFKDQVCQLVKRVPKGKVTTYGEIAMIVQKSKIKNQKSNSLFARKLAQSKQFKIYSKPSVLARAVGNALHQNKDSSIPCHRVVDRNGRLAPNFAGPQWPRAKAIGRRAFEGAIEQRRRLEAEGVKFVDEMHVDLELCLWQSKIPI